MLFRSEAVTALLPLIRAGSVRAIAVTSAQRTSLAPEIPTMAEVGLPELDLGAWWGMWGPPALPAEIAGTINGWVNEAVKDLAAEGRLTALGIEPILQSPKDFAQFLSTEVERTAKLLKAANFQPE